MFESSAGQKQHAGRVPRPIQGEQPGDTLFQAHILIKGLEPSPRNPKPCYCYNPLVYGAVPLGLGLKKKFRVRVKKIFWRILDGMNLSIFS
jgi:hypothetical protein